MSLGVVVLAVWFTTSGQTEIPQQLFPWSSEDESCDFGDL